MGLYDPIQCFVLAYLRNPIAVGNNGLSRQLDYKGFGIIVIDIICFGVFPVTKIVFVKTREVVF